jgi:serine phosphatase RsbU (regulator of sigma subunit)/PAS domain-containing protein
MVSEPPMGDDLRERVAELRAAAAAPQADARALLDAALVELDGLIVLAPAEPAGEHPSLSADDPERRMLRAVFAEAPVPLLILDADATVRRANRQAGALFGVSTGYLAGKRFTALCDVATRAAFRSHLAKVRRTEQAGRVRVRLLSERGPVEVYLTMTHVSIPGEAEPLIVAATAPLRASVPTARRAARERPANDVIASLAHRLDVATMATRIFLEDQVRNESVALRRCGRLLADELADWVIIDTDGDDGLVRRVVIGPDDERGTEVIQALQLTAPDPDGLPAQVAREGNAVLHAHLDDLAVIGSDEHGTPLCARMGVTSLMVVPIGDGLGAITLGTNGEQGPLTMMDLGLAERLAQGLALVLRTNRHHQRDAAAADALHTSLLPRSLPSVPSLEIGARNLSATTAAGAGGDFYDVFPSAGAWGLVVGDVCGKGRDAAALTAMARHGIRLLSRADPEPGHVLAAINDALLEEDRFVTASVARIEPTPAGASFALVSAGHPPGLVVRADGAILTLAGGGIPLGLFGEDFEVGRESVDLALGDTLFLYSDGVLEAVNAGRERFGRERLIEILAARADLPADDLVADVGQAVLDFCDGELRDDVTILALRAVAG